MKAIYPARFILEDDGQYSILFPDLSGCITAGDNLEHGMSMAQEALGLYLVSLEEHKQPIPAASKIDTIEAKDGEFVTLVMVEVNQYRRKRIVNKTLTLPAWLNEAGEKAHINFSGVLQEALKQKLGY